MLVSRQPLALSTSCPPAPNVRQDKPKLCGTKSDPPDRRVLPGPLDMRDRKAPLEHKDLRVRQAPLEHKDLRVRQAPLELPDLRVRQVLLESPWAIQPPVAPLAI